MQTDRKKLGIFIIVLGFIIIFLIIYFVFIKKNATNAPVSNEPVTGVTNQLPIESGATGTTPSDAPYQNRQNYDTSSEATRVITGDDLGKISMSFAERFGSFSNQSNYGNFTDLKILMTDEMKAWSDRYVSDLKKQPQNQNTYYGVTTKALTYKVVDFNAKAGTAEILVTTQRRESTEKINGGEAYNQDITLTLENSDAAGNWLFNSAVWTK